MKSNKKYTVSILTYIAVDHAKKCVDAVLQNSPMELVSLVLWSNGNADALNLFNGVKAAYPQYDIEVVDCPENKGFIEPNETSFSKCKTKYFVMVNDDTVPPAGWLEALEEPFDRWPATAVISGPECNASALRPDFSGVRSNSLFEYLEFSTVMVNTEIVKKHGSLFGKGLKFAYGEDSECCLRMRRLGYTLHKVPIHVPHVGQATSKHVKEAKPAEKANHAIMAKTYKHYMNVRKFDYPIRIRRWAAIGDIILATPVIRRLREENPVAKICVECAFPEIFKNNPYVTAASQAVWQERETCFYNLDMAYENRPTQHVIDAYADVCELEGKVERKLDIFTTKADDDFADSMLYPNEKYIAIHMGPGTWATKNWETARWKQVIEYVRSIGHVPLLVGKGNFKIKIDGTMVDMRDGATIHQTAALLRRARALVTIDSMPLHLAQAVGTPVVGLWGATRPQFLATDGSKHVDVLSDEAHPLSGARHKRVGVVDVPLDGNSNPMDTIQVESVVRAIEEVLK